MLLLFDAISVFVIDGDICLAIGDICWRPMVERRFGVGRILSFLMGFATAFSSAGASAMSQRDKS